jgi:RNA polymerase sigma factor (TIGR02999 family)
MASRTMRRILIDHARSRSRLKRAAPHDLTVELPAVLPVGREEDLLLLDDALTRLEAMEPRQCRVVECRFFAGMTNDETAEALDVSIATVKRDWTLARAWLNVALADAGVSGIRAQDPA